MDWFYMPVKVMFEDNVIIKNKELFSKYGKRCLIVTGRSSAKKSGVLSDVLCAFEELNIESFVFDEVMENPTFEIIQLAQDRYKDKQIDFVLGIGGGSPLDASKMIGVLLKNVESKSRDLLVDDTLTSIPILVVPTTSGTGSETTPYSIITDHQTQSKINCKPKIFPEIAFIDVKYYMSMPINVIKSTGVDALCHLVEGYLVKNSNIYSDQLAVAGLNFFAKAMEDLKKGNFTKEMHVRLIHASTIAGMVISHAGTGIPHGMGYYLTYHQNTYHGKATALFLASMLELDLQKNKRLNKKAQKVLDILGLDSSSELREFIQSVVGREQITTEQLETYSQDFFLNKRKLAAHDFEITITDIKNAFKESLDVL